MASYFFLNSTLSKPNDGNFFILGSSSPSSSLIMWLCVNPTFSACIGVSSDWDISYTHHLFFHWLSDHPHADHRQVYFVELWNHNSFILSSAFAKVFFVAGLKNFRGRIFLCSGETSAPAVLTVILLRQHSMTLFRNINIYTTHMLILRNSKYPVENVLFRNTTEIFFTWMWLQEWQNSGCARQILYGNIENLKV